MSLRQEYDLPLGPTDMQQDQILVRRLADSFRIVGEVVGWPDEDTVLVQWPAAEEPVAEPMADLTPAMGRIS
jgi:hypothetical protein